MFKIVAPLQLGHFKHQTWRMSANLQQIGSSSFGSALPQEKENWSFHAGDVSWFCNLIIKHPFFQAFFCGRVDKLKSRHVKKSPGTSTKISTNGWYFKRQQFKGWGRVFFLNPPCIKGIKNLFYTSMNLFSHVYLPCFSLATAGSSYRAPDNCSLHPGCIGCDLNLWTGQACATPRQVHRIAPHLGRGIG